MTYWHILLTYLLFRSFIFSLSLFLKWVWKLTTKVVLCTSNFLGRETISLVLNLDPGFSGGDAGRGTEFLIRFLVPGSAANVDSRAFQSNKSTIILHIHWASCCYLKTSKPSTKISATLIKIRERGEFYILHACWILVTFFSPADLICCDATRTGYYIPITLTLALSHRISINFQVLNISIKSLVRFINLFIYSLISYFLT